MTTKLPTVSPDQINRAQQTAVDDTTLTEARKIVDRVRHGGDAALKACIETFEQRSPKEFIIDKGDLERAFGRLPQATQVLLRRTAKRIRRFAIAQRACITPMEVAIEGGAAGHDVAPVDRAACYAPGGRFPLPSTVLMTAVTAKAAGVRDVVVVTPSDDDIMLGAAFVADADMVIHAGGAHAVAAVAYGTNRITPVDMIVGPGNRWVTAAKSIVSGTVGIDMLAGPSELLVVCDDTACPNIVAADLLAQAEHDPDARPILVTQSGSMIERVNRAICTQLETLDTRKTAEAALNNGMAVLCTSDEDIITVVNTVAPEHLELIGEKAEALAPHIRHYGGLFIGQNAAEVLGDYGAGPNHTLPTGGTARFSGGLSVFNFLRVRTWMRIDEPAESKQLVSDAQALAEVEGLWGHKRAAQLRD